MCFVPQQDLWGIRNGRNQIAQSCGIACVFAPQPFPAFLNLKETAFGVTNAITGPVGNGVGC